MMFGTNGSLHAMTANLATSIGLDSIIRCLMDAVMKDLAGDSYISVSYAEIAELH